MSILHFDSQINSSYSFLNTDYQLFVLFNEPSSSTVDSIFRLNTV